MREPNTDLMSLAAAAALVLEGGDNGHFTGSLRGRQAKHTKPASSVGCGLNLSTHTLWSGATEGGVGRGGDKNRRHIKKVFKDEK